MDKLQADLKKLEGVDLDDQEIIGNKKRKLLEVERRSSVLVKLRES